MTPIEGGIPGFYASISLAQWNETLKKFVKKGPLITNEYEKVEHGKDNQGTGEPSTFVDRNNQYIYMYFNDHNNNGIGLARALLNKSHDPNQWKKYYRSSFTEKGIGGKNDTFISAAFVDVIYVKEIDKYIMISAKVSGSELESPSENPTVSGFYFSTSNDGLNWSNEKKFWNVMTIPRLKHKVAVHPTLEFVGTSDGKLEFYVYFGYSASWGHNFPKTPPQEKGDPHHLARMKIKVPK
jgi:hypothetical protein